MAQVWYEYYLVTGDAEARVTAAQQSVISGIERLSAIAKKLGAENMYCRNGKIFALSFAGSLPPHFKAARNCKLLPGQVAGTPRMNSKAGKDAYELMTSESGEPDDLLVKSSGLPPMSPFDGRAIYRPSVVVLEKPKRVVVAQVPRQKDDGVTIPDGFTEIVPSVYRGYFDAHNRAVQTKEST